MVQGQRLGFRIQVVGLQKDRYSVGKQIWGMCLLAHNMETHSGTSFTGKVLAGYDWGLDDHQYHSVVSLFEVPYT